MKKTSKVILLFFLLLLSLFLAKTFFTKSRQIVVTPVEKLPLQTKAALDNLAGALQIQTISYDDPSKLKAAEFLKFHDYLRQTFPLAYSKLSLEKIKDHSLLFHWRGEDSNQAPVVLMAHMDVVPVEPVQWQHPPFGGKVADGYIWGRGALDDKSCILSQMEAVEYLLSKGFVPKKSVYLAYGHDEEAGGQGAAAIAELLKSRGIRPDLVLDEGGAVLNEMIPGVLIPTALIGTSEKGYVTLDLQLRQPGGHSSAPPEHTAIGMLSIAIQRLEANPMSASIEGSAAEMLDYLGPELPFVSRFFLANRWFFQPLMTFSFSRNRITNAMIRTTTAVTMMRGGVKENVLPGDATATINFRIRPGETMEDVIKHVRKTIDNDKIEITKRPQGMNPSPISPTNTPQFETLHRTIRQVFPGVVVVPGMVIGATDARHYSKISKNVYRFAPFSVTMEDFGGVHGTDERIRTDSYVDMIRFYVQLLRNTAS